MADEVLYLYAVTDADRTATPLAALSGVDGAPVDIVTDGALTAAVSRVDAERFSAAALQRSLEDLGWLEAVARAHDAVVSELARSGPVAPVRLATVFLTDGNLRAMLRSRSAAFSTVLDRVRGCVEWSVKAFLVTEGAPQEGTTDTQAHTTPGRAYLERKRRQRDSGARRHADALERAEAVHVRLAEVALASRRYPAQDRRLSGYRDEMLLNAAYLAPEDGATALADVARDAGDANLRVELTGPWAPYSFATLEDP